MPIYAQSRSLAGLLRRGIAAIRWQSKEAANDCSCAYYVRFFPSGQITYNIAASPNYPESEYFGRRPHPLTVWFDWRSSPQLSDDEVSEYRQRIEEWAKDNLNDV